MRSYLTGHRWPRWGLAAPLAALLLLQACSWWESLFQDSMDEKVVALVNGLPVTVQEVDDRLARLSKRMENSPLQRPENTANLKRAIVTELINRKLLLSEAKARGLSVTAEETAGEKERLSRGLDPGELREAMAAAHVTPELFERDIGEELLIRRLLERTMAGVIIPESEIEDYYRKNAGQFFQQESVRARRIVVGTEEAAMKVKRQLAAGKDFARLAEEVSQSPDARNGGDLGFFQRGQMPADIEGAAFSLSPGQVSGVIETPYGYHLLKVEERRPARQPELSEVREEITGLLLARKQELEYEKLLSNLGKLAKIRYNRAHADILPRKK